MSDHVQRANGRRFGWRSLTRRSRIEHIRSSVLDEREAERRRREATALGRTAGVTGLAPEAAMGEGAPARKLFRALGRRVAEIASWRGAQRTSRTWDVIGHADGAMERASAQAERLTAQAAEHIRRSAGAEEGGAKARAMRQELPRHRRGTRHDPIDVGLFGTAFVGADVLILKTSQTLLPGVPAEHTVTALLLGLTLFGYAHIVGWVADAIATRIESHVREWLLCSGTVIGLLTPAFIAILSLQGFRSESLQALAESEGLPITDPTFFGFMQAMMLIGAALASFRFHAGAEGRRLLRDADDLIEEAAGETANADDLLEEACDVLAAAEELVASAAIARQQIEVVARDTEHAVRIAETEADVLAESHDTAYVLAFQARVASGPPRQLVGPTARNHAIAAGAGALALGVGLLGGLVTAMAGLLALSIALVVLLATSVSERRAPDRAPEHPALGDVLHSAHTRDDDERGTVMA